MATFAMQGRVRGLAAAAWVLLALAGAAQAQQPVQAQGQGQGQSPSASGGRVLVDAPQGFRVLRVPLGSGTPVNGPTSGLQGARHVADGDFHVPNYLPGHPTAATIWPRELQVECVRDLSTQALMCDGYDVHPALGRGEYIYVRPVYRPEPPAPEPVAPAPAPAPQELIVITPPPLPPMPCCCTSVCPVPMQRKKPRG